MIIFLFFYSFNLFSSSAFALDGYDLVKKSFWAEKTLNYEGTQVNIIDLGKGMENNTVQVFHAGLNKSRLEYLSDGKVYRIVLDDGLNFWDYRVKEKQVIKKNSQERDKNTYGQLVLLKKNYLFKVVGNERIAEQNCTIISIYRKNTGILMKKIWQDQRTGLLLKIETYDLKGKLNSIFYFKRILYKSFIPKSKFVLNIPENVKHLTVGKRSNSLTLQEIQQKIGQLPIYLPAYIPKGYVLDNTVLNEYKSQRIVHTRYSDGVNAISFFQSSKPITFHPGKQVYQAVRLSIGIGYIIKEDNLRILIWERQGKHFAAVGHLSDANLIKIANSIRNLK